MIRALLMTAVTTTVVIVAPHAVAPIPDPCALVTNAEATKLTGAAVTKDVADRGPTSGDCSYSSPGKTPLDQPDGVEVKVMLLPDTKSASARVTNWTVIQGTTAAKVPSLADEAFIQHTSPVVGISAVIFRRGTLVVSIGVHPPASDAALVAAATTALSRF